MKRNTYCHIALALILVVTWTRSSSRAGYPEATIEQATQETIDGLKIDRYEGLNEQGIQAEYQWAVEMAELCLVDFRTSPRVDSPAGDGRTDNRTGFFTIEFQRHAGRTARRVRTHGSRHRTRVPTR